jgi:hypothetical protein
LSKDKRLLGDNPFSNKLLEISSSRELNFSKYKLVQTNKDNKSFKDNKGSKDNKSFKDNKGYKDYKGKECKGYKEDKEYKEYKCKKGQECQECQEGEDETNANLQDFMKQHKHLEHAKPMQGKLELELELYCPTCLKNPFSCNNKPRGDLAFNISS